MAAVVAAATATRIVVHRGLKTVDRRLRHRAAVEGTGDRVREPARVVVGRAPDGDEVAHGSSHLCSALAEIGPDSGPALRPISAVSRNAS